MIRRFFERKGLGTVLGFCVLVATAVVVILIQILMVAGELVCVCSGRGYYERGLVAVRKYIYKYNSIYSYCIDF